MSHTIKIEEIPDEIKEEVLEYAEYLMEKLKQKNKKSWLSHIDRGHSINEMTSETIEKMRTEEKW